MITDIDNQRKYAEISSSQLYWWIPVIAGVISIAVVLIATFSLDTKRKYETAAAFVQSKNLVHNMDEEFTTLFECYDEVLVTLCHIITEHQKQGAFDTTEIADRLNFERANLKSERSIEIIDSAGTPIHFTPTSDTVTNYSKTPYFTYLKSNPSQGMYITKPFKDPAHGDWVVAISRLYTHPDGSFGGTVVITVPVADFQKRVEGLDIGSAGFLMLRYQDIGFTAGFSAALPDSILPIGDTAVSPELVEAVKSGVDNASFFATAPFDHVKRAVAYNRIGNAPYFVVAGLAEKDYLSGWRRDFIGTTIGCSLFLIVLWGSVSALIMIRNRRERELREAIIQQEKAAEELENQRVEAEKYRILMDSAPGFGFIKDKDLNYVMANRTFCDLLKIPYDEIRGKTDFDIFPDDLAMKYIADDREVMNSGTPKIIEEVTIDANQNDRRFVVATRKLPWYDSDGNLCGVYGMGFDITELKTTEEELHKALERLTLATTAGGIGIWEYDCITGEISWDRKVCELYGIAPDEFTGDFSAWQAAIHPDDRERCENETAQALASESSFTTEFRIIWPDGSVHTIASQATPHRDRNGVVVKLLGTNYDITARKASENALQAALYELKKSQEVAKIGNWVWYVKENRVEWSDEMYNIFGIDRELFTGDLSAIIQDCIHPDDRERVENSNKSVVESNTPIPVEYRIVRPDGAVRHVWAKAGELECDNDNNPILLRGIVHDITDRKKSEEELFTVSQRLKLATESAKMGVWDWDVKNNIMVWDDRMMELYGLTPETFPGGIEAWLNGLHPEDYEATTNLCQEALRGEKEWDTEFRVVHPDGKVLIIKADGVVIRDSEGTAVRMIGVNYDITEKRQLESEREKIEHHLQQQQKLESLGFLAGGIAHDFNNLMGGIFGYIQLAQLESTDESVQEDLQSALQGIERARGLTHQLLTFAKGGAPVCEVAPLFPHIEKSVRFAMSGSNCTVQFSIADDLFSANYDKNQIGQVIDNIVINALHAMPSGGNLHITACNCTISDHEHITLGSGEYIKIEISDTGIGISQDQISKIFDPFFTTKQIGQGLGLSTSYSIIKRHGGTIDVESEVGTGTTFTIYLPAVQAPVSQHHFESHRADATQDNGTVIIMDDEEMVRTVVRRMLTALGYKSLEASDGREAIELCSSELNAGRSVKAMIFDLTVPQGLGGIAAMEELQKRGNSVPVIVASGYAEDPVMKSPKEFGFTASIAKPFLREPLKKVLAHC